MVNVGYDRDVSEFIHFLYFDCERFKQKLTARSVSLLIKTKKTTIVQKKNRLAKTGCVVWRIYSVSKGGTGNEAARHRAMSSSDASSAHPIITHINVLIFYSITQP